MNLLTFTSLWPNHEQPGFAPFVKHRVAAMARADGIAVRVVAPVPYFPRWMEATVMPERWRRMARVAKRELIDGLQTWHPRYLVTPQVGMSFYARWMARGAAELVGRLHAEQPLDCIDAHYVYPDGATAVMLGARLNVPVFITARGTDINLFAQMPLIRPQIVRALQQAAGVIAVSQALKDRMVELGIDAAKIAVIRNGIDRAVFHPRDRQQARARLRIDEATRAIVTVAALVPLKRINLLIDAIGLIADPTVKLYVIGEGSERRQLDARIAAAGLGARVFLLGARPQTELVDWYAAADLFCLASSREGCPNVVLEAMACGAPVVAANVGGLAELVTRPEYGKLINDALPASFAAEIRRALAQPWQHNLIAVHGGARSWDDVAREALRFIATHQSSS